MRSRDRSTSAEGASTVAVLPFVTGMPSELYRSNRTVVTSRSSDTRTRTGTSVGTMNDAPLLGKMISIDGPFWSSSFLHENNRNGTKIIIHPDRGRPKHREQALARFFVIVARMFTITMLMDHG